MMVPDVLGFLFCVVNYWVCFVLFVFLYLRPIYLRGELTSKGLLRVLLMDKVNVSIAIHEVLVYVQINSLRLDLKYSTL